MKNLKLSLKFPYEDIGIYFSLLEENVAERLAGKGCCGWLSWLLTEPSN
jgi:hypothetical protein